MSIEHHTNKVTIIGCGNVGMTAAYSILHDNVVNELVLFGRSREKLLGEELDINHALSFLNPVRVYASDNYEDIVGSDMVVITAGAAQKPGESRLNLVDKNLKIVGGIMEKVLQYAPDAVVLIVSNPVDILTYKANEMVNFAHGRIFGSGTTLDTARFRYHLSEYLKVNPKSIHTYILGEHGDHSFPYLSGANIGGNHLSSFEGFTMEKARDAYQKARDAAYKIIESKGSTFYGIGSAIANFVRTVLVDAKSILPVSVPIDDYYGQGGVAISLPCIIGRNGIERKIQLPLNEEEQSQLSGCCATLKKYE